MHKACARGYRACSVLDMDKSSSSRFDAQDVVRLSTANRERRLEMQFCDDAGKKHVVTLPLPAAVELACFICEVSEHTPFLGGVRKRGRA